MASRFDDRQIIYISSYPKSGSTWLTRLLADVLDSPSGGSMPQEDSKEIATEGQDRPGNYIIRKGHFTLVDNKLNGGKFQHADHPVVSKPHRLAWQNITDERIVFLVRDPRDICVSGAYHWRQSTEHFLERMIAGDVARCGRWDDYCNQSSYLPNTRNSVITRYEDLLLTPFIELSKIFDALDLEMPSVDSVGESIRQQSFATRKAQIGNDEKELRRNNMRKGIVGDWRNHFTAEMQDIIWPEFGWMMERLGYDYH